MPSGICITVFLPAKYDFYFPADASDRLFVVSLQRQLHYRSYQMKHHLIYIGLLWMAGIFLPGCDARQSQKDEDCVVNLERCLALTDAQDSPQCKISIRMEVRPDTTPSGCCINRALSVYAFGIDALPAEAADSFCNVRTGHYKNRLTAQYEADRKYGKNSGWYDYRYGIVCECVRTSDKVTGYRIDKSTYEGGLREIQETQYLNFHPESGAAVTLKELFTPSYKVLLPTLLLHKLQQQYDCKSAGELKEKGILRLTDIYIPDNFLLKNDGIIFRFNPDEIAPYETGSIELSLSYGELKSFINKDCHLWN